jgi:hypothetical protein
VTIYAWRKRFGALEAVDVERLRQLGSAPCLQVASFESRIDKRWRVHLPEYSMIACDRRFSFSGDPKMVPSGGFRYVSIVR